MSINIKKRVPFLSMYVKNGVPFLSMYSTLFVNVWPFKQLIIKGNFTP